MTDRRDGLTYAKAGVDIDAGAALVEAIKPLAKATRRPGADAALGGFGALFDLKAAGYADPLLVATTDGVGTKLKVAIETGHHDGVGIDLVAMCVNDLLAQGAEPLMFLDYSPPASSRWRSRGAWSPASPRAACRPARPWWAARPPRCRACTATATIDLAGFSRRRGGARRRCCRSLDAQRPGDLLIGLGSSGPHSNGYSLMRRIVERSGLSVGRPRAVRAGPVACRGADGADANLRRRASCR